MKMNQATQIIRQEIMKKHMKYQERKAIDPRSVSVYFKIYSNNKSLLFRVSDHPTKSNVITLRVDHKNTEKSVLAFVKNRINDLSCRSTKSILGMR